MLDEAGLNGFTMRALARRLGTYPATIYWHVGNRTEVLSAVSALVLDRRAMAELPDPVSTPWDEWLIETAHAYRRAMQQHPALAVMGCHALRSAGAASPTPGASGGPCLPAPAFAAPDLVGAYNAYVGSLVGWVGLELIADDPELGSDPERLEASVHELSADAYPTVVANLEHLADRAIAFRWHGGVSNPLDDAFEFALATWIDGLRQRRSLQGD